MNKIKPYALHWLRYKKSGSIGSITPTEGEPSNILLNGHTVESAEHGVKLRVPSTSQYRIPVGQRNELMTKAEAIWLARLTSLKMTGIIVASVAVILYSLKRNSL
jgi:hypothetical protein